MLLKSNWPSHPNILPSQAGISLWIWPAICKNPPFPATLWHLIEVPRPLHVGLEGGTDVGGVATEAKAVHHADVERPVPGGPEVLHSPKDLEKSWKAGKSGGHCCFLFRIMEKLRILSFFFGAIYTYIYIYIYTHIHIHIHIYIYIQLYIQLYN